MKTNARSQLYDLDAYRRAKAKHEAWLASLTPKQRAEFERIEDAMTNLAIYGEKTQTERRRCPPPP